MKKKEKKKKKEKMFKSVAICSGPRHSKNLAYNNAVLRTVSRRKLNCMQRAGSAQRIQREATGKLWRDYEVASPPQVIIRKKVHENDCHELISVM